VSRGEKRPRINRRIVGFEFMVKEVVPSEDLGILPGSQGGSKGESTASCVGGSGSENIVQEEDVVQHELLVCQPCDENEDVEVVAERKTNSRSDDESWDGDGNGEEDCDEDDASWDSHGNGGENDDDEDEPGYEKKSQYVISTIWHTCLQEGCEYKAKERSQIKKHLAYTHDIGVTWHTCPQEGCEFKAKQRIHIKTHLAGIHDIGVTWYTCPQEGCEYKAKERPSIKRHLASIHDIGVIWHTCPQEGCEYKSKQRSHLKTHLAHIHDIGVTWHTCPQEGCEYKAKERGSLKRHISKHHV
jgi:hypothetical protein